MAVAFTNKEILQAFESVKNNLALDQIKAGTLGDNIMDEIFLSFAMGYKLALKTCGREIDILETFEGKLGIK